MKFIKKILINIQYQGSKKTIKKIFNKLLNIITFKSFKKDMLRKKILEFEKTEDRFSEIYKSNYWSDSESRSGIGSNFQSTENIQAVSSVVKDTCETEADRMETELTIVRYIAWAIPSIGFLGTVRGIGTALGQAYQAVSGDIVGVTQSLGVAFNSTFVALVVSIVLMFILHQLQLLQDRLVLDCQNYCDERLIRHMQVPERIE